MNEEDTLQLPADQQTFCPSCEIDYLLEIHHYVLTVGAQSRSVIPLYIALVQVAKHLK